MFSTSRHAKTALSALVAPLLILGSIVTGGLLVPASAQTAAPTAPITCQDLPVVPGQVTCMSEVAPAAAPSTSRAQSQGDGQVTPQALSKAGNFTPSDIAAMYGLPGGAGAGTTVAVIEVGSSADLESNLATYRANFGLPACTKSNGCLTEVNQTGGSTLPGAAQGWDFEINMDVQAVSAACPACKILVVDAASAYSTSTNAAIQTAVRLGAKYVSMSFGTVDNNASVTSADGIFDVPDVTFVASSGDYGYARHADGVDCGYAATTTKPETHCTLYPSSSPHVVSAGGTSVRLVNGAWQHAAWDGAGSGCSPYIAMPTFQKSTSAVVSACGTRRATSDVSALADASTGMLVYASGGWWNGGGTSLAAPLLASMYAMAGNHTAPFAVYGKAASLTDVTSGSTVGCDGTRRCAAGSGWDGPTGLGTPNGLAALTGPSTGSTSTPPASSQPVTVALATPGDVRAYLGQSVSWSVAAKTAGTYTYAATGLPSGLRVNASTGVVSGTVLSAGLVTVTASGKTNAGNPASGSVSFRLGATSHRFVRTGATKVTGVVKRGKTVRASYGTFRSDSVTGGIVRPSVHITWLVNGKPVKGATGASLKVQKSWKGKRLSFRVALTAPHYTAATFASAQSGKVK